MIGLNASRHASVSATGHLPMMLASGNTPTSCNAVVDLESQGLTCVCVCFVWNHGIMFALWLLSRV